MNVERKQLLNKKVHHNFQWNFSINRCRSRNQLLLLHPCITVRSLLKNPWRAINISLLQRKTFSTLLTNILTFELWLSSLIKNLRRTTFNCGFRMFSTRVSILVLYHKHVHGAEWNWMKYPIISHAFRSTPPSNNTKAKIDDNSHENNYD